MMVVSKRLKCAYTHLQFTRFWITFRPEIGQDIMAVVVLEQAEGGLGTAVYLLLWDIFARTLTLHHSA